MAIGKGHFLPLFIVLVILFFLGSRHLASARVFASDVAVRTFEDEEISKMTISQLKKFLNARGVSHRDVIERQELERRVKLAYAKRPHRQRASASEKRKKPALPDPQINENTPEDQDDGFIINIAKFLIVGPLMFSSYILFLYAYFYFLYLMLKAYPGWEK